MNPKRRPTWPGDFGNCEVPTVDTTVIIIILLLSLFHYFIAIAAGAEQQQSEEKAEWSTNKFDVLFWFFFSFFLSPLIS